MKWSPLLLVCVLGLTVAVPDVQSQNHIACSVTCEPDGTSSGYPAIRTVRAQLSNERGTQKAIAPKISAAAGTTEDLGSQSFSYAVPLLMLPGRAGLDLSLTLYYDSGIWTIDKTNQLAVLNADRDYPSYGFKLGFGYLEMGSNSFVLTESDGTKRALVLTSGSKFVANDNSQIDYDSSLRVLRYRDGTQILYQNLPQRSSILRPTRITDRNGNYISASYVGDTTNLDVVTDTLGRQIKFVYDENGRLIRIDQLLSAGGTKTRATFGWGSIPLKYNFSGISVIDTPDNNTSINVVRYVQLPNGAAHVFEYGDWGLVTKIKRTIAAQDPLLAVSRSTISYDYPAASTALSDHPTFQHQTLTYFTKNSAGTETEVSEQWTHTVTKVNGTVSSLAVTDPAGTKVKTNLNTTGIFAGMTDSVEVRDSSNTLLRTTSFTWASSIGGTGPELRGVGTILNDSGHTALSYYYYDNHGNVLSAVEYGFDGQAKRNTITSYSQSANYLNRHIYNLPIQILVQELPSQTIVSRVDLSYDGTTPVSRPGVVNHDDSVTNAGNLTQIKRYRNPSAATGAVTRNITYDNLGNALTADIDCCSQKSWTFSPDYRYAYRSTESKAGLLSTSATYDFDSGALKSSVDENGQTTTYSYADPLDRLTDTQLPNSVTLHSSFVDDVAEPQVRASNSANAAVQWRQFDGIGRLIRSELRNGDTTVSATQFEFAPGGRLLRQSNPFAPGANIPWTTYTYDPLGRTLTTTLPDQATYLNSYLGNSITVKDPAGKQRRTYADAWGRTIKIDEPGWGDALPSKGSVVISGSEKSVQEGCGDPETCVTVYDQGTVSITVNGHTTSTTYTAFNGRRPPTPPTAESVAAALTNAINQDSSASVNASVAGTVINLTSRTSGFSTNSYQLNASSTTDFSYYFGDDPSFYALPSGPLLEGGQDATSGQNVASLSSPMSTTYAYDAVGHVTSIVSGSLASVQGSQKPGQTRSYSYDGLGNVLTVTTPESGAVTYTYTDFGKVQTRRDARGVLTTYGYDGLNRLHQETYDVTGTTAELTPTVTFDYGTNSSQFNNGRLYRITDGTGSETYSYNKMGQVAAVVKVVDSNTYQVSYAYNPDGSLQSTTYPTVSGSGGRNVTNNYDSLSRLQQIISNGTNLITVSSNGYDAAGQLQHFAYGNGVTADLSYNERLQLSTIRYFSGAQEILNLAYRYTSSPTSTDNNGQIRSIEYYSAPGVQDLVRSENFEYDAWGQVSRAYTSNLDANIQGTWRLEWNYDRFGNRLNQTLTGGSLPVTQPQLTVNETTNCISSTGFQCDANGNLIRDPVHTYAYDAENHLTKIDGGTTINTYDGNGVRVSKTSGTNKTTYLYSGAHVIQELQGGQAPTLANEYVYWGGQKLAVFVNGVLTYTHPDHLSTRARTDSAGQTIQQFGHLPFGETWYETGQTSKWKFTTYERLDEALPDYAVFRDYSSRYGRFVQTDPISGTYGYNFNDPVNLVDPLGLDSGVPTVYTTVDVKSTYLPIDTISSNLYGDLGAELYGLGGVGKDHFNRILRGLWGDDEGVYRGLDEIAKSDFKKENCRKFLEALIKAAGLKMSVDELMAKINQLAGDISSQRQVYNGEGSNTKMSLNSFGDSGGTVGDWFVRNPAAKALSQSDGLAIFVRSPEWASGYLPPHSNDFVTRMGGQPTPYGKGLLTHEILHKIVGPGHDSIDRALGLGPYSGLGRGDPRGREIGSDCF